MRARARLRVRVGQQLLVAALPEPDSIQREILASNDHLTPPTDSLSLTADIVMSVLQPSAEFATLLRQIVGSQKFYIASHFGDQEFTVSSTHLYRSLLLVLKEIQEGVPCRLSS